ncbi:MAG TPA: L,D-transpeptidase, partial [Solirubrobacteraceae bacterium]|nr:L,D-transpeptidase [Solirubrobacteraceae bacterium]
LGQAALGVGEAAAPRWVMPRVGPGETLAAQLVRPTDLRRSPGGDVVTRLDTVTRFGSPQTLAIVSGRDGWYEVLSAALRNGETGWIEADDATVLRETWSIEVDLSRLELTLLHQGRVYARMEAGIGAPGMATPSGLYAVTDRLTAPPGIGYGCCILGLTGRQPDIPQGWQGGDRIAIHGTDDAGSIGAATSHGCIHLGDADIRLLMAHVPLGAQVRVVA